MAKNKKKNYAGKKNRAAAVRPRSAQTDVLQNTLLNVKCSPWIYVAAFFIPALLTLIAYIFFGIFPFGDRSVLALDLNGQYVYYFEAIRDAFWGDGSIFYNWSRDLSGEFMGIIGYYLASPFTLIVILLPRKMILESLFIMQLCKLGTAGLTFSIYVQKSKRVQPLQSLIFSTMYAMMGYAVIQLIDPMWIDGIVFLPLIILGLEYLIDDGRKLNFIIPLAVMFIANFYIGFMTAIFVAIYFFFYLFFGTDRKFKDGDAYFKVILRMAIATLTALMCSAIMILPVYNALKLGKFEFSTPDYSFATQFSPIELVPTLLPNQYYSVNMQGLPEIYCGVLSAVLLPLFYVNKKIKKNLKVGYSLVVFVMLLSMYIKPLDMLWHGGQTPNWLPYRYSFLLAFVFVSMAATVFSNLDGYKLTVKAAGGTFAGIAALVLIFKALMKTFEYSEARYKYVAVLPYSTEHSISSIKSKLVKWIVDLNSSLFYGERDNYKELWLGTLVFGVMLAAFYLVMLYLYSNTSKKKSRTVITCCMAAVVFFEASYNAYDSFKKVDKEVAFSDGSTYYNEIQAGRDITDAVEKYDSEHDKAGLYRSEKTFFRTVNDNLAYGMRGISHSSSVMNTRIINFIETMGYSMRSYVTRYDGNTDLADSLLGIKYVVDDPSKSSSLLNPNYEELFTQQYINNNEDEATFHVYKNPNALSVGYMVDDDIKNLGHLGNDNPFNSQNMFMSTITGNTQFSTVNTDNGEVIQIDGNKEYYTPLGVEYSLSQCTESPYGDQKLFTADSDAVNPVINIHVTAQSEEMIYMYLKTYNEKAVNTWISSEKDENGEFINHKQLGSNSYFENHDYAIVRAGSYPAGTELEIRLTIRLNNTNPDQDEYTIIKDFFFYHFNYDLFKEDIDKLAQNQWQIEEYSDRYISGKINAKEGQLMLTTIPSEPGWSVWVDGKKTDTIDVINAFIGIELEPGEHTVVMKYTHPGFIPGVILLILGIGAMIVLYMYDRKNNKVIIARLKAKQLKASGAEAAAEAESKKPVEIIKSGNTAQTPQTGEKPPEPEQQAETGSGTSTSGGTQNKGGNKNSGGKKKKKKR